MKNISVYMGGSSINIIGSFESAGRTNCPDFFPYTKARSKNNFGKCLEQTNTRVKYNINSLYENTSCENTLVVVCVGS